jgi:hypothetical protein
MSDPTWIPVAERKPPEGRHLVVHRRGPHAYVDVKVITYECETGAMPRPALHDVSHWMPLPEPPV